MRTSWQAPSATSPLVVIPDNISDSWESQISSLCYQIAKINAADMLAWLTLHYKFSGMGAEYQVAEVERNYKAFLAVQKALQLTRQRLQDIQIARATVERAKHAPWNVAKGVTVHRKGFASTDTAVVVQTTSMPVGLNESIPVAVLDRALGNSTVCRVADLVPLTYPPVS